MILITIILIVIYAIVGNLVIRYLDSKYLLFNDKLDDVVIFILGFLLPLTLFYIGVREISHFIFDKLHGEE